jgi:hypothetical protein
LGSYTSWRKDSRGGAAGHYWVRLTARAENNCWSNTDLSRPTDDLKPHVVDEALSFRNFQENLFPETRAQRVSKIKTFVDEQLRFGSGGHILIKDVAKATGYRQTAVYEALLALEKENYRFYEHKTDLAVGKGKGRSVSLKRHWALQNLVTLLGVSISVGFSYVKEYLGGTFLVAIVALYVCTLTDRSLNRYLERKRSNRWEI